MNSNVCLNDWYLLYQDSNHMIHAFSCVDVHLTLQLPAAIDCLYADASFTMCGARFQFVQRNGTLFDAKQTGTCDCHPVGVIRATSRCTDVIPRGRFTEFKDTRVLDVLEGEGRYHVVRTGPNGLEFGPTFEM